MMSRWKAKKKMWEISRMISSSREERKTFGTLRCIYN